MPTNFMKLHPTPGSSGADVLDESVAHAVGVTVDRLAGADEDLVMIDPWPGIKDGAKDRSKLSPALELAHRDRNFHALIYYWTGWS